MAKHLFKLIVGIWLWSLLASFAIAILLYSTTEGNEARQVYFLMLIGVVFLSVANIITLLPIFLNLIEMVRNNPFLSGFTFIAFPLAEFIGILLLSSPTLKINNTIDFFMIASSSGCAILISLYYFFRFRRKLNDESRPNIR